MPINVISIKIIRNFNETWKTDSEICIEEQKAEHDQDSFKERIDGCLTLSNIKAYNENLKLIKYGVYSGIERLINGTEKKAQKWNCTYGNLLWHRTF